MKKLLVGVVVVGASLLTGCSGRPLNQYDRAAILGASENQALQNAHDAAWGNSSYHQPDHKHHQYLDDNGVVYQDGQKGYLDAGGDFHAY